MVYQRQVRSGVWPPVPWGTAACGLLALLVMGAISWRFCGAGVRLTEPWLSAQMRPPSAVKMTGGASPGPSPNPDSKIREGLTGGSSHQKHKESTQSRTALALAMTH
eukprot:symbB.v1.2.027958.t1/scaffold2908.1/size67487/1